MSKRNTFWSILPERSSDPLEFPKNPEVIKPLNQPSGTKDRLLSLVKRLKKEGMDEDQFYREVLLGFSSEPVVMALVEYMEILEAKIDSLHAEVRKLRIEKGR